MITSAELKQALHDERESYYYRLRGGFPIPLAGATWWCLLGIAGFYIHNRMAWIFYAFVFSGMLFPLAILYARLFRNNFLRDQSPVSDALIPTFASMMLFWPMAIAAFWTYPQLVPLILAIGLSIHWPVIGWTYARPRLYTAHSVVRAIVCFALWVWFPSTRFTLLPFAVSAIYLITVIAIFIDSSPKAWQRKIATKATA